MEAAGIVDTHLVDSHRRGSSGVWGDDGRPVAAGS
jgi:DNA-3-methyladenine glycosylase I